MKTVPEYYVYVVDDQSYMVQLSSLGEAKEFIEKLLGDPAYNVDPYQITLIKGMELDLIVQDGKIVKM